MRWKQKTFADLLAIFCVALLFPATYGYTQPAADSSSVATMTIQLVQNYRKILSLQEYSNLSTVTQQQHQEAVRAGEYLFLEDQHLIATIDEQLIGDKANAHPPINEFLTQLASPELQDADLFAARALLTDLARKAKLDKNQGKQVRALLARLANAHNKYGQELDNALKQKKITQEKPDRPEWTQYLSGIVKQYPPESVLSELDATLPTTEQQTTPSTKTDELVAQTRQNEWKGLQLEKGEVLLTFDDGPHPVYTREILEILEKYKVKAIFFQLGQNLGTVTNGQATLTKNEDIEKAILDDGNAIGNHSFTHPFLPKLDQAQVEQEIDKTQALLNLVITDDTHRTHMFRAPYGARNSMILGEIGERNLRSVLWNIDSLDWSDPIPESIVHRILQELDKAGRGIILMHDIHPKTVIALPMLLDELDKRGYRFVQWDNGKLVETVRTDSPAATPTPLTPPLPTVVPDTTITPVTPAPATQN